MSSKKCVVIACVSFETAMIVEPTVSYGADEVHLFHYIRDPESENGRIYTEFYEEVCSQMKYKLPHIEIVEHDEDPIYDFQKIFRALLQNIKEIKAQYPQSEVLINASAGTSEFSAAAIVAAMMSEGVDSFTVGTRDYTIRNSDIRELYYKGGKPVGLTEHTHAPRTIPNFNIEMPEKNQVQALRIYFERLHSGKTRSASAVIQQLKDEGLWTYTASPTEHKTNIKQKETMYYQRHYLETWIKNGWLVKVPGHGKYEVTDSGVIVINTFFTEPEFVK